MPGCTHEDLVFPENIQKRDAIIKVRWHEYGAKWNCINCFSKSIEIASYMAMKGSDFKLPNHVWRMGDWLLLFKREGYSIEIPPKCQGDRVAMDDIHHFEKHHPEYFVTIIGYENDKFYPVRTINSCHYTRIRDGEKIKVLILFLYKDHYCPVKSLDTLLRNGVYHGYYCKYCFKHFGHKHVCDKHMSTCTGLLNE